MRDDRILHAVRYEWDGVEGVDRWEWYIVARASDDLLMYLWTENAFGLADAELPVGEQGYPKWFRVQSLEAKARSAKGGGMLLILDEDQKIIYATGKGNGFASPSRLFKDQK